MGVRVLVMVWSDLSSVATGQVLGLDDFFFFKGQLGFDDLILHDKDR